MSNDNSVHNTLEKVRKPRVHITYEVETEGSQKNKELPLVGAVLSDLSGNNPQEELKPLKERRLIQIDKENFDGVMAKIKPGVSFNVENTFDASGNSELPVSLAFNSMDDFEPEAIVKQVEPLNNLLEIRGQLRDLLSKADRSEALEQLLETLMQNSDELEALMGEIESPKKMLS
ncbi:MAG: type VI secretion system contractile sheath small subunit [Bdellovibrionota bacterium]